MPYLSLGTVVDKSPTDDMDICVYFLDGCMAHRAVMQHSREDDGRPILGWVEIERNGSRYIAA